MYHSTVDMGVIAWKTSREKKVEKEGYVRRNGVMTGARVYFAAH